MELLAVHDRTAWNQALLELPQPHVLQSWEWGALKSRHGWLASRWLVRDSQGTARAGALVLRRQISRLPISLLYVPKGPIVDHGDARALEAILAHLEHLARRRGSVFVKIDPDVGVSDATFIDRLLDRGWQSAEQVQFRNTMALDLAQDEEALLAAMKSKWRYNIRLAARRGVTVQPGVIDDLSLLYGMYRETSLRDGFVIRPFQYYRDAWGSFIESGLARPFIAYVDGDAVAMVIIFRFGDRVWYMYGASRNQHRDKMPNHLLQWEAIRWARSVGCTVYDFWGAPDELAESDPMWGVYRFKQGFGATLEQHIGAYDYVGSRFWYWVYTTVIPRLLNLMRRRYWDRA
jgi:lipid II:glycine glycyltransferase (peptidoglycan interpeptide bridge formation enzyme)